MRLDKYLKVSRIIKRRTVAHDAADKDKVLVNDKIAKPSTDVKIGDIITIQYFKKHMKVKVTAILDSTKKQDALEMFEVIEIKDL